MKTILRAVLVGVLLVISLTAILLAPLTRHFAGLLDTFVVNARHVPLFQRLTAVGLATFGLVALAGVLSDWLVFFLVPVASSWMRRLFHALGLAGVFLIGLVILGTVQWSDPGEQLRAISWLPYAPRAAALMDSGQLDLGISWPFVFMSGIGFVGYLLVSFIIRPAPRLSRVLVDHLTDGEKVLCSIRQTRWRHPITPDSVVATNRRVIVYRPTNLGFTSTVEDYNYVDIANIKTYRGWLFSTVFLTERFEGNDLEFHDMLKYRADAFARVVTEQLRAYRGQLPLSPLSVPTAEPDTDSRRVLQRRLAAGEITAKEYQELLRHLDTR